MTTSFVRASSRSSNMYISGVLMSARYRSHAHRRERNGRRHPRRPERARIPRREFRGSAWAQITVPRRQSPTPRETRRRRCPDGLLLATGLTGRSAPNPVWKRDSSSSVVWRRFGRRGFPSRRSRVRARRPLHGKAPLPRVFSSSRSRPGGHREDLGRRPRQLLAAGLLWRPTKPVRSV